MNDAPIGGRAPQRLLLQPLTVRGLTLKDRLVVPPMAHYRCEKCIRTPEGFATPTGVVTRRS